MLALRPDNADILNNRGVALNFLNRPEDALASYKKALTIKPNHVQALGNRGAYKTCSAILSSTTAASA